MKKLKSLMLPVLFCTLLLMVSATSPDKRSEKINDCINVLQDFSKMKESIPHELIEQYQGIVIIPKMINAGFAVGGKRGKGLAIVKLAKGKWSDPVFVTLTGGSLGLQIGVQSVDLVLVFRHKGVLTKVRNGDFTVGGDISVAAGPVGRSATASTDYKMKAEVYSYSRSRGLFAGISINGSNLAIDKKADASFYGPGRKSDELFETSTSNKPVVKELKTALNSL
jgi:lipid-binding SYLF domain-containing protein